MIELTERRPKFSRLEHIKSRLEQLKKAFETARENMDSNGRDYLLPPEDRRIRRLFRTYLNSRDKLQDLV